MPDVVNFLVLGLFRPSLPFKHDLRVQSSSRRTELNAQTIPAIDEYQDVVEYEFSYLGHSGLLCGRVLDYI